VPKHDTIACWDAVFDVFSVLAAALQALRRVQPAKLEPIGTLAAGIAHEVKNPWHTMLMGLDYLANNVPAADEGNKLALNDMRDAVKRANSSIRELWHFSTATAFETQSEDLPETLGAPQNG
jgi:hypothetical protein